MTALERSQAYCRGVARTKARNFYYSFLLLSRAQRDAMSAIYTFMRHCDDLSDEPGDSKLEALSAWRTELDEALQGRYGEHPCWPAFHDAVRRYAIPCRYFHEMIDGVTSDLEPRDIQTFDELYRYCYQVASVVGMTVVHIFGFKSGSKSGKTLELAEKCGVAFQLTNIIRDVKEDQLRGRVYLPREDRERYPDLRQLLAFEARRAQDYYRESEPLLDLVHPRSRKSLWALITIYRTLLDRIEESGFDVMSRRIRLSAVEKLGIVLRALIAVR
jgi:15-cis-phytoene synthase